MYQTITMMDVDSWTLDTHHRLTSSTMCHQDSIWICTLHITLQAVIMVVDSVMMMGAGLASHQRCGVKAADIVSVVNCPGLLCSRSSELRHAMGRIKLLKDSNIRFPGTATPVTIQLG